jgi:5-methylcytosine-specific restriction endonuclease McrA
MPRYKKLSDAALTHGFDTSWGRKDVATADILEYIVDFDERKLHVAVGYPSLLDYCVQKQRRTRDSARKHIHAAHTAEKFPVLFDLIRQGQIHLSGVVLLAAHLTPENVDDLVAAAAYKSKEEIRQLLQFRLAKADNQTELAGPATGPEVGSESEDSDPPTQSTAECVPCAPGRTESAQVVVTATSVRLDDEMKQLVGEARMLGYQLRSDDPMEVVRRGLRLLVGQLRKKKTREPRARKTENPRCIPTSVMNAVWNRGHGRCTFVGDSGQVCGSCEHLQFDHIEPVARGGESTVANLRLGCRAHNQFEAERAFGSEFMENKRKEAQHVAAGKRAQAAVRSAKASVDDDLDVIPWLRTLGFRMDQAKRAAAHCETIAAETLEDRVRAALTFLAPPHRRMIPHARINGASQM